VSVFCVLCLCSSAVLLSCCVLWSMHQCGVIILLFLVLFWSASVAVDEALLLFVNLLRLYSCWCGIILKFWVLFCSACVAVDEVLLLFVNLLSLYSCWCGIILKFWVLFCSACVAVDVVLLFCCFVFYFLVARIYIGVTLLCCCLIPSWHVLMYLCTVWLVECVPLVAEKYFI
jgi:hypothetical protein